LTPNIQKPISEDQENSLGLSDPGTEPLWTVSEVAEYLRINLETVRMMARRGELPSLKVGKRLWRFRPSEVKQWLHLHVEEH